MGAGIAALLPARRDFCTVGHTFVDCILCRVIPAFTANAVPSAHPRHNRSVEVVALGSLLLILVGDITGYWYSLAAHRWPAWLRLHSHLTCLSLTDSLSTSAIRVCQPGPVAFQRARVSGGSRRLMATFESGDFGRPRGLNIAAAVRAPKIFGSTCLAGRASATMAAVHSGFVRWVFLGFDGFFISVHLALVGFTQTDHPGLAVARLNTTLCSRSSMQPSTQ